MFKQISATNFFSWKQLDFDFQSGITLINGQNLDDNTSEGSGKSSIPNALCWGLYGQLPKDVNIDDVIKTGEKSCCVVITLENGDEIVRFRKPNQLYIQSGDSVETGKDMKETQKMINDIIGMSFDTFCQSVYFAQNYSNKFITASQEDKVKILSELQDLTVFDKASKKANDQLKEIKSNTLLKMETDKTYKEGMLSLIESELNTFIKLSDSFDQDKLNQLDELIIKNDHIAVKIKEIDVESQTIVNLDSIHNKNQKLEQIRETLSECQNRLYHIQTLKIEKQKAINSLNCPTCGQHLPNSVCIDIVIPDDTGLKQVETTLKNELNDLGGDVHDLIMKKAKNELLNERLNHLIEQRKQLNKEVSKIESMYNPYLDKIHNLSIRLQQIQNELDLLNQFISEKIKEIKHLEFLKDGFKEIKSYVFQSMLTELNNKTNQYIRELFEIPASITFDNISDEGDISKIKTIVMLDGYERSLGLLSGGQFRRVQLAVDFALSDIVSQRSKNPINLRILDEAFKDLSEVSQERVINLLQNMKGSTILIEHNSLIKSIVNHVYNVELKNGTSIHG